MTPAITADGLSKRYDETVAVESVDLQIDRGTVYGFLGPNGAGKTTTMRTLTTLTVPTSGTATVAGAPVTDRDAVVDRIGYLLARFDLAGDANRRIDDYSREMKQKIGIV